MDFILKSSSDNLAIMPEACVVMIVRKASGASEGKSVVVNQQRLVELVSFVPSRNQTFIILISAKLNSVLNSSLLLRGGIRSTSSFLSFHFENKLMGYYPKRSIAESERIRICRRTNSWLRKKEALETTVGKSGHLIKICLFHDLPEKHCLRALNVNHNSILVSCMIT